MGANASSESKGTTSARSTITISAPSDSSSSSSGPLQPNDRVKITLDEEIVKELQQGHGGWVDDMKLVLNQFGTVIKFDDDGDVVVKFDNGKQFVYNPNVLEKIKTAPPSILISLGDLIRIEVDERRVKQVQSANIGYNAEMKTCLGKVAYVRAVPHASVVRAKSGPRSWTWNQQCVKLLTDAELRDLLNKNQNDRSFAINDFVLIDSNIGRVKRLQVGHGEWVDSMKDTLGKYGYVKRVLNDGDLRVKVHGTVWTYSPEVVKKVVPARDSNSTIQRQPTEVDAGALLLRLLAALSDEGPSTMSTLEAVRAGNVTRLRQLQTEKKLEVDEKHEGHALIEIACILGQFQVVEWLIDEKCDIHVRDSDGDQPIHEAALYGHPNIVRYLIRHGADANSQNNRKMTPLHWAVNKGFLMVVQVLVDNGADINAQDEHGDTPLHDAINKDCSDVAKYLIQKNAELAIVNKKGFTTIHWIALKGRDQLLRYLLEERQDIVPLLNQRKEDGFTALHLAALNNNAETCRVLCECPGVELNCATNSGQTPVHMAAIYRSKEALEALLECDGIDVDVKDNDGDTALHEAIRLMTLGQLSDFQAVISEIIEVTTPSVEHPEVYAEIAKLLVRRGADVNLLNDSQTSPIGLCLDADVAQALRTCAEEYQTSLANNPRRQTSFESAPRLERTISTGEAISENNYSSTHAHSERNVQNTIRVPTGAAKKESEVEILRVQKELSDLRRRITCPICMDSPFQFIFQCGHGTCQECSSRITECPICRKKITSRTVLHGLD